MPKLFEQYKQLKQSNQNKIILFKSGVFYIAISDDATILSNRIGLKLTYFNNDTLKCGFPVSRVAFYTHLLKEMSIDYIIVDNNSDYKDVIDYILSIDMNSVSYNDSFEILQKVQDMIKKDNIKEQL